MIASSQAEKLLLNHNLRLTHQRIKILSSFFRTRNALSHTDLEAEHEGNIDRATIYRCLKQFLDAGILHRIPDDQFQTRYAVCGTCETHSHHHDHVHFNCRQCLQTQCIEEIVIPNIPLPEGFLQADKILIVQGICRKCREEAAA
jgi:Fur family ferric uptake transcriptional regulator